MRENVNGLLALELELELVAAQRLLDDGNISYTLYDKIMREILREVKEAKEKVHEDSTGERSPSPR